MLTSEIRVNTANFLRKGIEQRKGPTMSRRYIKRIVCFLIIGVVSVLAYCVFSTTRMNAQTGWAGGVQNMHIQGNKEGTMQDNIQENRQGFKQDNRHGNIQENRQGNMEDNIQENRQGNMEDNIQENRQGNLIDNIQENRQGNLIDNIQENRQGNLIDNIQENRQGNRIDNIQENRQGNILENRLGNMEGNIQENRQGNIQENRLGNMEGNIQENRQGNIQENRQGNMIDNIQENRQGNILENRLGNMDGNIQENRQGNILENRQGNILENRQGNILENRLGNMEGNIQENRQGNIQENRQGNMIDNIQENRQGNILENRLGNMDGNIQENRQGNILENRQGNIQENRQGNILENRQGNILENRQGNILENRQGNIIDNAQHLGNENLNLDAAADGRRVHENVAINGNELAAIRQDDGENKAIQEGRNVVDNLREPEQAVDVLGGNPFNIVKGHETDNRANDEKTGMRGEPNDPAIFDENMRLFMKQFTARYLNNKTNDLQKKDMYPERLGEAHLPSEARVTNKQENPLDLNLVNDRVKELLRLRNQELNPPNGNGNNIPLNNDHVGDKAFYPVNQAANQMFPSNNILDNARNRHPFQLDRPHQNKYEGRHDKGKQLLKMKTFDQFLQEQRQKGNVLPDPGAFQQPLEHLGVDNNPQNNFIPNKEVVAPRDNMDTNLVNKNIGESIDLRNLNPFVPGNVDKPQDPNPWHGASHNQFHNLNPFFREKAAQQHVNPFVQNNPNLLAANPLIPAGNKIKEWENFQPNKLLAANPLIPAGDKINDWGNNLANRQNGPFMNGRQILQTGSDDAGQVIVKPDVPVADGDLQHPGVGQPHLPEQGVNDSKNIPEKHDTQDVNAPANPQGSCVEFRFPTGTGKLCMPGGDQAAGVSDKILRDAADAAGVMDQILLILSNDTSLNFIDAGAMMGWYSTAAALMSRDVLAIEPLKSNHQLLHRTALENYVFYRIKLLEHALDREPYIGLAKPAEAAEIYGQVNVSRLLSDSQQSSVADGANIVHVTTLNKLVPDVPFRRALMRLGFHGGIGDNFLDASDDFFRKIQVPYIITHWPGSKSADVATNITATLETLGFRPHMRWNGPEVTLDPLQTDYKYLVWKRE